MIRKRSHFAITIIDRATKNALVRHKIWNRTRQNLSYLDKQRMIHNDQQIKQP